MGGRGFELVRITPDQDAETYHVLTGVQYPSCDCRGFEAHGHCKHVAAVQKILDEELMHRDLQAGEDTPWNL